jgi:hypothetical protein
LILSISMGSAAWIFQDQLEPAIESMLSVLKPG